MPRALESVFAACAASVFVVSAGLPARANPTTLRFGPIESGQIVRGDVAIPYTTKSTAFVDVPGARITVVLNDSQKKVVIARWAGEVRCYSSAAGDVGAPCSLQVISSKNGGAPEFWAPNGGTGFAIQTVVATRLGNYVGASMVRSNVLQGPGTFLIKLQARTWSYTTELWLDDWSFEVDVAPAK